MGTVVRRNAPNGEVPRPLRPFVSSWKTVQCGLAAASRKKCAVSPVFMVEYGMLKQTS